MASPASREPSDPEPLSPLLPRRGAFGPVPSGRRQPANPPGAQGSLYYPRALGPVTNAPIPRPPASDAAADASAAPEAARATSAAMGAGEPRVGADAFVLAYARAKGRFTKLTAEALRGWLERHAPRLNQHKMALPKRKLAAICAEAHALQLLRPGHGAAPSGPGAMQAGSDLPAGLQQMGSVGRRGTTTPERYRE